MKNDTSLSKLNADIPGVNQGVTRNRSIASAHPSNYPNLKLYDTRQSPKMQSGKLRDMKFQTVQLQMPFSQLDLSIGKLSRGTNVPAQFERKEMEKIFNQTVNIGFYKKSQNSQIGNLNEVTKNNSQAFNEDENNNNKILQQSKSFYVTKDRSCTPLQENNTNTRKNSGEAEGETGIVKSKKQLKNNSIISSPENEGVSGQIRQLSQSNSPIENCLPVESKNLVLPSTTKQDNNFLNQAQVTNDKWMPTNYREYERQVKTAHARLRDPNFTTNTPGDRLPSVSVKEIKKKAQESDIFFTKNSKYKEQNFNKARENHHKSKAIDYQDSDIFMLKNNNLSLEKNAEKYLEAQNKIAAYNTSSRSNSEWQPKNACASLLNHGSTKYSLLNPDAKNSSKTKEQIIAESMSINNFNPIFKQKSLCEFLDLTRVGVPNPNKEYLNALKKTKNGFGREANMCSTYLDLHRMYRGISDRPFVKKIV
jgi:hypothetical protein